MLHTLEPVRYKMFSDSGWLECYNYFDLEHLDTKVLSQIFYISLSTSLIF
jgi:hypothetical protein